MLRLLIVCMMAAAPLSAMAADGEANASPVASSAGHSWSNTEAARDVPALRQGASVIVLRQSAEVSQTGQPETPRRACQTGVVGGGFCVLN
jgi:hypothetical protein